MPRFATAYPLEDIHTGHNLKLMPHLFANTQTFLDLSGDTLVTLKNKEYEGGLDAKWVLRQGMTVDLTVNPDFSQVQSDEPQVTVNRRY